LLAPGPLAVRRRDFALAAGAAIAFLSILGGPLGPVGHVLLTVFGRALYPPVIRCSMRCNAPGDMARGPWPARPQVLV